MSMLHAKVIVNPVAGACSTRRKWPGIRGLLGRVGLSFDHEFTEGVGHAIELAKAAASDGYRYLLTNPILSFAPGVAIMLLVFAFNMVGDGLRDALDPRFRGTF